LKAKCIDIRIFPFPKLKDVGIWLMREMTTSTDKSLLFFLPISSSPNENSQIVVVRYNYDDAVRKSKQPDAFHTSSASSFDGGGAGRST